MGPVCPTNAGKVVLWLVVWLIFLFDVVVDISFLTEFGYLGRVCATGFYDQQIPGIGTDSKLFSVQHRDGNESCTDLDLTASGTCSQDATRLFDYCGWQTMCGSGYTNTVEKCFINLDVSHPFSSHTIGAVRVLPCHTDGFTSAAAAKVPLITFHAHSAGVRTRDCLHLVRSTRKRALRTSRSPSGTSTFMFGPLSWEC